MSTTAEQVRASAVVPAPRLQARLTVGAVDDPLEDEADQIAERVLRMPDPGPALIQRCPGGCPPAGCGDDEPLRRTPDPDSARTAAPPAGPLPGGGAALPAAALAFFEPRFGAGFGDVRVHADERAARLSADLGARAFTVGRDVFFGRGEYAPSTWEGRRLLGHELAHVVQQSGGARRQAVDEPAEVEHEGELEIDRLVAGRSSAARVRAGTGPLLQRACVRPAADAGFPINVDLGIPATPTPDRSLTTAQISALAGDPDGITMGFTRLRSQVRWRVGTRTAGGRSWLTSFRASLRNPSMRIFLTRELADGSCELADLTRHERQHDTDFRENVVEGEESICATAGTWPAASSYPAAITPAQLQGLVDDWMAFEIWQMDYAHWLDGCIWDTVDYPRMFVDACPGTAFAAPEASCGDDPARPAPQHTIPLPDKQN